jgi:hypothetical protein
MRITLIVSLIFAAAAIPGIILTASEPLGLLMWGGGLIVSSVALGADVTKSVSTVSLSRREPVHGATPSLTQSVQG